MNIDEVIRPVIVRSYKPTRKDINILQVEFIQEVARPVNDPSSLLNVMMQGHKSFGSPTQTRVAFQNMSIEAFKDVFNLEVGREFPLGYSPRLVVHEFCEGDIIPESLRGFYNKKDIFIPRSWSEYVNEDVITRIQSPKMTPKIEGVKQQVLSFEGSPIYRNVFFTISGLDQKDYLIQHDNNNTKAKNTTIPESVNIDQIGRVLIK